MASFLGHVVQVAPTRKGQGLLGVTNLGLRAGLVREASLRSRAP